MRGFKFASLGFTALVTTVGATSSCHGASDDCQTLLMCPGGGSAGSSGSSGDAGGENTAGTSGASGTSGTSGGKGGDGSSGSSSGGKSGMSGSSGMSPGGEGGGAGMGGGCDTSKSPTEEACLVTDDYAVFVAPSGNDNDDGSQATPLASLTKAVQVAAGAKLVVVCDATYNEHVVVSAGAHVYGGFKCADWTAENAKPLFKPTTAGPALKIDGVDDEVFIDNVSFEVGDAANPGETALTAIVNQSPKVTLRDVRLKAGKGKAGAKGTLSPFDLPPREELDGYSATNLTTGGAPKPHTCPGGAETSGGIGGSASPTGQAGGGGSPDYPGPGGEPGQPGLGCGSGGAGLNGANAPDSPAASGATALGVLTASGWNSGNGGDGSNGGPGQGGGGGASSKTGGGSGGGAGACGGAGAKGGQGGGGSIALAVLTSAVAVESCELISADAGDGGASVAGQSADKANHEGGFAGTSTGPGACPGGAGGLGGDGGAGGGGAGGISVGVVWKGAKAPTVSADTTITNGKAGMKGIGGVPGTNDGIAGVAQKILSLN